MINIKHYVSKVLSKEELFLFMKYFGRKKFKSLSKMRYFLHEYALQDIQNEKDMQMLAHIIKKTEEFLESEEISFDEKKAMVLSQLDKNSSILSFLEPKGATSVTVVCPKCKGYGEGSRSGKPERGWIPDHGNAKSVICQHRTSCGFSGDFIAAYAEEYNKSYGEALNILANELGIDFTLNEVHVEGTYNKQAKKKFKLIPKQVEEKPVEYMSFDGKKEYLTLDWKDFVEKYKEMSEEQQFKMIATAIYEFSLSTNQDIKKEYYFTIDVSAKKHPELIEKVKMIDSKLGCIAKDDIAPLIKHLEENFPLEDLVKYGVLNGADHLKAPLSFKQKFEEALIVIPNFDLYTNMCSGLKYRKTKLKSWYNKKIGKTETDTNKEPEFSYGRVAKPLPYHLTREAFIDKSMIFRFFEGQKDLHSIPFKNGACDVAIPGVNGISEEMLGLFKGRKVYIFFDQDRPGQEGAEKLIEKLKKAGAIVYNVTWDLKHGGDVNDVLKNGFDISKIAQINKK